MADFLLKYASQDAEVAELVDAHDSKSCLARGVGSIPTFGTEIKTGFCTQLFYFGSGNRKAFEPFWSLRTKGPKAVLIL